MSKNSEVKLDDRVYQMFKQIATKVRSEVDEFYPNGGLPKCSLSSEANPLASLLAQAKALPASQTLTQEQLMELCQMIRTYVKEGKPNNIELQLNKGRQVSDKQIFPLGNTAMKLRVDANEPRYFFIRSGDILDASVFLSRDCAVGIMLIKNENGDDYFIQLSEFHMLSFRENPDPRKEVGLMTSFVCLTSNVYTTILYAPSLDPIKNLLLSEWLLAEWQRAKDALLETSDEPIGGESNG